MEVNGITTGEKISRAKERGAVKKVREKGEGALTPTPSGERKGTRRREKRAATKMTGILLQTSRRSLREKKGEQTS